MHDGTQCGSKTFSPPPNPITGIESGTNELKVGRWETEKTLRWEITALGGLWVCSRTFYTHTKNKNAPSCTLKFRSVFLEDDMGTYMCSHTQNTLCHWLELQGRRARPPVAPAPNTWTSHRYLFTLGGFMTFWLCTEHLYYKLFWKSLKLF